MHGILDNNWFLKAIKSGQQELTIKFYDSVTGKLLFITPGGCTLEELNNI